MSKQRFAEILIDHYNIDDEDQHFIEELRDKYPYCQTVQILLAKCYQKKSSPYFENQVNIASAYSIDRIQFQNYISEKLPQDKIADEQANEKTLEENIKPEPISEKTESPEAVPTKDKPNEEISIEERKKQLEQIVQNRLKSFENKKKPEQKNKQKNQIQAPIIPTKKITPEGYPKKNTRSNEIIEKFIREDPRINKPKDSDKEKVDLSVESVKFNDDVISETLAEIYLKQGEINKSLEIYNKLSLKFPEKNRYFAKKIEQIKNNII